MTPPPSSPRSAETRARILDAAERIVLERGVAALTLDGVAESSGLSKGGLIYHFPSKDALITAMLGRLIEGVEQRIADHCAGDPDPGAWTRGYVLGCQPVADSGPHRPPPPGAEPGPDRLKLLGAALLAAVAANLSLLAPLHERLPEWMAHQRADGIDALTATVVRLAADGLWMNDLFGIEAVPAEERPAVIERLLEMTRP